MQNQPTCMLKTYDETPLKRQQHSSVADTDPPPSSPPFVFTIYAPPEEAQIGKTMGVEEGGGDTPTSRPH